MTDDKPTLRPMRPAYPRMVLEDQRRDLVSEPAMTPNGSRFNPRILEPVPRMLGAEGPHGQNATVDLQQGERFRQLGFELRSARTMGTVDILVGVLIDDSTRRVHRRRCSRRHRDEFCGATTSQPFPDEPVPLPKRNFRQRLTCESPVDFLLVPGALVRPV
jgi:hypothetical protein